MPEIGQLLSLEYGAALPAERRAGHGFPVFGSNGEVGRHDQPLVDGPGIVVGRKGSVGKVCWSEDPFWPIDTTYWVKCAAEQRRWIYWLLSRLPLGDLDSSTGVPGLNRNDVYELSVFEPPTGDEKSKIAEILDTLDTTIRQTEAIIEKLKQVKQGLLHDLLTRGIAANGELRPPHSQAPHLYKDSPLGWIPMEWEVKRLGLAIADAYRYPSYFGIDYVNSGVPEVRGELIGADGTLDPQSENYRYISKATAARFTRVHLRKDDIVMSVRGTIGKFALVPKRLEGAVITANLLKLTPDRGVVHADWLLRLLLSQRFQAPLDAACSSTTIKTIQVPELMAIRVAVPSLAEQQAANDRMHAIESVLAAETSALEKLRLQKSGLMDDLLTGRVRVTPLLQPEAAP